MIDESDNSASPIKAVKIRNGENLQENTILDMTKRFKDFWEGPEPEGKIMKKLFLRISSLKEGRN